MNNQIKYIFRRVVLAYYNFRYSARYPVVMPLFILVTGIFIFVVLIMPQLQNWFSIRGEVEATQKRIATIRQNTIQLENINKLTLDNDLQTATAALPSDKDFIGILNAIGRAATLSNVSLDDYQFSLGTIILEKGGKKVIPASTPIQIELSAEGNIDNISRFIYEIERKLPIAEIKNINFSDDKGEILLLFYMKPLPDLNIVYADPITVLSQEERGLLQILYQWARP